MDPDPHREEQLDPDPQKLNADPQPWIMNSVDEPYHFDQAPTSDRKTVKQKKIPHFYFHIHLFSFNNYALPEWECLVEWPEDYAAGVPAGHAQGPAQGPQAKRGPLTRPCSTRSSNVFLPCHPQLCLFSKRGNNFAFFYFEFASFKCSI